MTIKLVEVDGKYQYTWPDGNKETYNAIIYRAKFGDREGKVVIGFTERVAYKKLRKRVVVFVDGYPEVEFAGTDDYDTTGNLVALIKKPDGKLMRIGEIHSEYSGLSVVDHSSQISKEWREGRICGFARVKRRS